MRIATIVILIIFSSLFSKAQTPHNHGLTDHEAIKILHKVKQLESQQSLYNAIDLMKDLIEIEDNIHVQYKLAMLYVVTRDYKSAVKELESITSNPENPYEEAWYYFGEVLRNTQQYTEAKAAYYRFKKTKSVSPAVEKCKPFVKKRIYSCNFAIETYKLNDRKSLVVRNLSGDVNHSYSEFSPFPVGYDTIYFASLRSDSILSYDPEDEFFYHVNLYKSHLEEDTIWSSPEMIASPINGDFWHSANGVFTDKGDQFFYTRCAPDEHNVNVCHIYMREQDDKGKWSNPKQLHNKINKAGFSSTQPSIGYVREKVIDKKTRRRVYKNTMVLYFSSDRPGGFGGKDIWSAQYKENGKFKKPKNCGKNVNSIGDEITPYYVTKEKSLYYSSNYHKNLGGFDVFKSRGSLVKFTRGKNLGLPINSSADDMYYIQVETDTFGYFVSNRAGGKSLKSETCCEDIYNYYYKEPPKIEVNFSLLCGIDSVDLQLDSVRVGYRPVASVRKKKKRRFRRQPVVEKKEPKYPDMVWVDTNGTSKNYHFEIPSDRNYFLHIESSGHHPIVIKLDTVEVADLKYMLDDSLCLVPFYMDSIVTVFEEEPDVPEDLSLTKSDDELLINDVFVLKDLYFDFDKHSIRKDSKNSLNLLMEFLTQHPDIIVELAGHTDSHGSDEYNLDLSDRRAKEVRKYVIKRGIEPERVHYKGYGETEPIAPNENEDGTDNPEGRQMNRRTEVRIIGRLGVGEFGEE